MNVKRYLAAGAVGAMVGLVAACLVQAVPVAIIMVRATAAGEFNDDPMKFIPGAIYLSLILFVYGAVPASAAGVLMGTVAAATRVYRLALVAVGFAVGSSVGVLHLVLLTGRLWGIVDRDILNVVIAAWGTGAAGAAAAHVVMRWLNRGRTRNRQYSSQ